MLNEKEILNNHNIEKKKTKINDFLFFNKINIEIMGKEKKEKKKRKEKVEKIDNSCKSRA